MFWGFLGEMQNASTIFLKETNGILLLGLLDMKCREISMQEQCSQFDAHTSIEPTGL